MLCKNFKYAKNVANHLNCSTQPVVEAFAEFLHTSIEEARAELYFENNLFGDQHLCFREKDTYLLCNIFR